MVTAHIPEPARTATIRLLRGITTVTATVSAISAAPACMTRITRATAPSRIASTLRMARVAARRRILHPPNPLIPKWARTLTLARTLSMSFARLTTITMTAMV